MQITVKGKHIDIGTALQTHVNDHLNQIVHKYFERAQEATVTVTRETYQFVADISIHVPGLVLAAHGAAEDAYAAFDQAASRLASRLRRHKSRIKNHHQKEPAKANLAWQQVLAEPEGELAAEDKPLVIAETRTPIASLSVMDAVAQLDLMDVPALLFIHAATGQLNMIYRRRDGHIAWIDPTNLEAA